MARAGRKRRNCPRQPNGRPQRETVADIKSVVHAQRAKVVPLDVVDKDLAGTPLGQLLLRRKITRAQYEAGAKFTRLLIAYGWAISAPRPFPKNVWGHSVSAGEWTDEIAEAKRKKQIRDQYDEMKSHILDCGYNVYTTIMEICGQERMPLSVDCVPAGLQALVKPFGLEHFEEKGN